MERLRKNATLILLMFVFSSCSVVDITQVQYLETDTYIHSLDPSDHAMLPQLHVSKSADYEERSLVKLPTGSENVDTNLDNALKGTVDALLLPFILLPAILGDFFFCKQTLNSANLQSATLVFTVLENAETTLTNKISLTLTSQPWWNSADWYNAHHFSLKGLWATPGGTDDPTFTAIPASQNGKDLQFDITNYFKAVLSQNRSLHYGMILKSIGPTLGKTVLASTQYADSAYRPRIVADYKCITTAGQSVTAMDDKPLAPDPINRTVFILGTPASQQVR